MSAGDAPGPAPTASPGGPARVAVQVAGFAAGIALLVWCVRNALKPENRAQLERLREASPGEVAAVLGLSLASLVVNGLVFWVMVRPVKRVDAAGMLSTNALATFLNYLPFKIGVLTRVIVHNKRDGIPVVTIGAWFGAMAATLMVALLPPSLAALWLKRIDWAWLGVSAAGVVGLSVVMVVMARWLDGVAGAERLRRVLGYMPLGSRFAKTHFFDHAHAGMAILAHGPTVAAGVGLRLLDLGLQAARFYVVAQVLHQAMSPDRALMAAIAYFLTGIFSPSGMLGTREGVTAWLFGATGAESFAPVTLLVGAAELVVNFGGAAIGLLVLRPDRLLRWKRESSGTGKGG